MAKQETKANGQAEEATEETFVPVGPGAAAEQEEEQTQETRGGQRDERDEERDDKDDRRAGHADDEEIDDKDLTPEVRAKRERRRAERKQRKEQYRRDQTELNFLRQRNESLERRFSTIEQRQVGNEQMTIDARIAQIDEQIRLSENIHAQAIEKQDGNSATEAMRIRDDLMEGKRQLADAKRRMAATATRRGQQGPGPDPAIAARAREWISENSWYDPQLRDPDSRVAKTIEEGLYAEGRIDPRSDAYWEEYNRRLSKYLPDRIKAEDDEEDDERHGEDDDEDDEEERPQKSKSQEKRQKAQKPQGPTFRTGGRERTLKKGEVYVSAERRKAMEEMGVWEDEELRNRYLKAYSRYDRENGAKH